MRFVVGMVAVAALAACGDNTPGLRLVLPYTPLVAQYRLGSSAWETAVGESAGGATYFDLAIDDDFELVVACRMPNGSVFTQEAFGTVDDWAFASSVWSCPTTPGPVTTATISGLSDQGTAVYADGSVGFADSTLAYSLAVPIGVIDLVAYTGQQIVIRHALAVAGDTTEPAISFATEGRAVTMQLPQFDAGAIDTTATTTTLVTANGTTVVLGGGGQTIVPGSVLATGDEQHFNATFTSPNGTRTVDEWYAIAPQATYTLLPELAGVAFPTASTAAWTALPDGVAGATFVTSDGRQVAVVTAGGGWLAERAAPSLAFDTAVPGLGHGWLPANAAFGQELTVEQSAYDATRDASLYETSSVGGWVVQEDP